jgi:hypothetical protein
MASHTTTTADTSGRRGYPNLILQGHVVRYIDTRAHAVIVDSKTLRVVVVRAFGPFGSTLGTCADRPHYFSRIFAISSPRSHTELSICAVSPPFTSGR